MHQAASASSISSASAPPAAAAAPVHSLMHAPGETRCPDVGVGAADNLHAASRDALTQATEALAALSNPYDHVSTAVSSARPSAQSSIASSAAPSPHLAPTLPLIPPAAIQHAPPTLLSPSLPHSHSMPPSLSQRTAAITARPRPAQAAPAPKATWASMYDQKSEPDTETESERDEEESKSPHRRRAGSEPDSDEEDSRPAALAGMSMSASSSSSSLHRSDSASALRKGISNNLQGLSSSGLREVELLIRKLKAKDKAKRRHERPSSSGIQLEGMQKAYSDDDDDVVSPSASHRDISAHSAASADSSHSIPAHRQAALASQSGGIVGLPSLGLQRSWNEEFQHCFTAICNDATILDNVAGYSALSSLAHDFLWTASTLGRIIISEKQLPESQKTIPSINVGGYAGGLKYVAHNILFKFAVDNTDGLYGGDAFAAKAAGHELLGLSNYYRTIASSEGRLGLHVPLAAVIDFRGYRLYATCQLPIDGARTLVLGSMNGGQTIVNTNKEMDEKMRAVAQVLNLKLHQVVDAHGTKTNLPSCFDIEGHQGTDGRFYLVDFHRTFPPEPPAQTLGQHVAEERNRQQQRDETAKQNSAAVGATPTKAGGDESDSTQLPPLPPIDLSTLHHHQSRIVLKNTYLYRLLRPELVRSYTASPLSSNVYSQFDRDPDNWSHVMRCYRGLLEKVIPAFAASLEKNSPPQRFVDSGIQMQQQTANMIRNSSTGTSGAMGGNHNAGGATAATNQSTPRTSRAASISSVASPDGDPAAASQAPLPFSTSSHLPPPALSLDVLSSVLHQSGINVRYLGLVRSQMRCPEWRQVMLVEIIARLLKNDLRARWRAIKLRSMSDGPFRAHAVGFINLIFFPSLTSNTYWMEEIHSQINLHFPGTLQGEECDPKKFHLKAWIQGEAKGRHAGGGGSGAERGQTNPRSLHASQCPVHHPGHTHMGVDPSDPLSFLPPINASAEEKTASNGAGQAQQAGNQPAASPFMLRSPSLPNTTTPQPPFARSVSTSVGYVKQPSHLPTQTGTAYHSTPQKKHHGAHHAHSPSTPTGTASGSTSATASSQPYKGRAPSIFDDSVTPQLPCTSLSCCSNGTRVDYLLLLFMRFIQLSGVVLEDGIMDAIQDAADADAGLNDRHEVAPGAEREEDLRQHQPDVVGEGVLQIDRTSMRDRQVSSSANGVIPAPFALRQNRSVTEPRGGVIRPPSPPPFQHALSQAAFPPLQSNSSSRVPANSPNAAAAAIHTPSPKPGMHRNLSVSSLAGVVSPSSHWRPTPLASYPSSIPSTPPSASGRSTPSGMTNRVDVHSGRNTPSGRLDAQEGYPARQRSRSNSVTGSGVGGAMDRAGGMAAHASAGGAQTGELWSLWSWPFIAPLEEMHIRGVVERVKQVNTLWYAEGTSLLIKSWEMLQQHNRWRADQRTSTKGEESKDGPQGFVTSTSSKRFFLPGHLQTDDIFRDDPTPFLKMAFHLAGLAANKYQQALRYCLDDNLTLCNLSFLMSAVYNKYSSAFSYLRRAVQANPMHVRSWYYLGQLYHYHLHERDQARFCYEKALSLATNGAHANTLKDYGNLLQYSFQQIPAAEGKYRRALEVEPRHIKSLQLLAALAGRQCLSLKAFDQVKKYLYDAARSPMGIVETRLSAQEKYTNFVICSAELYTEEWALERTMKDSQADGKEGLTALQEAAKRWREAIDFLLCPHAHYESTREDSATASSSSTSSVASMVTSHVQRPAVSSSVHLLSSPSSRSPSISRTSSTAAAGASSLGPPSTSSSAASASSDAEPPSTPSEGFSWCVCADCCGVHSDALPLADTLLSYAEFIHSHESTSIPPGLAPSAASAYSTGKLLEAEKQYQWAIMVHHTLTAVRKRHRQAQIQKQMRADAANHGAHEVITSPSGVTQNAYSFLPPAVKTAYLVAPSDSIASASSSSTNPPLASTTNSSVPLSQFLTPSWLVSLGLTPNFSVIVSKPIAVLTDAQMRSSSVVSLPTLSIAPAASSSSSSATTAAPALARPASSWDSSKEWTKHLPAVIPATPTNSSTGIQRSSSATVSAAVLEKIERDLQGAELALEVDLEYDLSSTANRRCSCSVDHSFGESSTSCACSFPSPRYLACYGFFLLRLGRFSQACFVFQAALAIQPFGRTASNCLARMADSAIRAGILSSGPNYSTNVVLVYGLYRRAVGLEAWEELKNTATEFDEAGASSTAAASSSFLPASVTACQLFIAFLKEHGNAIGPIAAPSAPSTPTSTTSHGSASSLPSSADRPPPTTGLLLRDADLTTVFVRQTLDRMNAEREKMVGAFKETLRTKQKHSSSNPTFALALVNTSCTCHRTLRGRTCVCRNDQLLRTMISQTRQMQQRRGTQRKVHAGELKYQDTGTSSRRGRQSQHHANSHHPHAPAHIGNQTTSSSGATNSGSARGHGQTGGHQRGGRGGAHHGSSSLGNKQHSNEQDKTSSTAAATSVESAPQQTDDASTSSAPKREPSWAGVVVAAPQATVKRIASIAGSTSAKDATKEGKPHHLHTASSSGANTPNIKTPVSASPILGPQQASQLASSLSNLAPLTGFSGTATGQPPPTMSLPTASSVVTATLPPGSVWKARAPDLHKAAPAIAAVAAAAPSGPTQPTTASGGDAPAAAPSASAAPAPFRSPFLSLFGPPAVPSVATPPSTSSASQLPFTFLSPPPFAAPAAAQGGASPAGRPAQASASTSSSGAAPTKQGPVLKKK